MDIQLLIDMKVSLGRECLLYQILDRYGDNMTQELQDSLRQLAKEEGNKSDIKKQTLMGILS